MMDTTASSRQKLTDPGLPPVQPPSAGMMFRLFLVPFLIVAVLVGLYLLGQTLYGKLWRTRSPEKVLRDLDNSNPDVRWRAASDLSQELPRSPELAADATFALALAERLSAALKEGAEPEQKFASEAEGLTPAEREARINKDLAPRRNLIIYLGASLGNFVVPVGVPLLSQMASQTSGMEAEALAQNRGRALFALSALGENLNRYDKLSDNEKDRIESQLEEGNQRWARPTLEYLQARRQKKANSFGVVEVLEKCSRDSDPFLRELAALAANFWKGDAVEQSRVEKFLSILSRDSGTGVEAREELLKRNPDSRQSRPVTKVKGFEVQVNANIALARLGSPQVRLDLFEQMLDAEALGSIFVITSDRKQEANDSLITITLIGSLRALHDLAEKRPELKSRIESLQPRVEKLAEDKNLSISEEATRTLRVMKEKG